MFMITWAVDENPKKKGKSDKDELQEKLYTVKLSNMTVEGSVFNDKFQLDDNADKMVQSEGFNLKISFYSKDLAAKGVYFALDMNKKINEEENQKEQLKLLEKKNNPDNDKDNRLLVPCYKYKRRNDK